MFTQHYLSFLVIFWGDYTFIVWQWLPLTKWCLIQTSIIHDSSSSQVDEKRRHGFCQWMNSSIVHGNISSLIHKKHHPKSHHSDIKYHIHPKPRNINLHNVTHSLISQNLREWMFVVQVSLLIVTCLSLMFMNFVMNANHPRSQPTPSHCAMCQYVECHLLILLHLLPMPLVECWCIRPPHHARKPWSGPH
jgi:hypothetical protein